MPGGGGGAPPEIGGSLPDAGATTPAGADPVTGQPLPAGQPETVTIKDGQREISVQCPDGQGHVKLTVNDGTGQPKTYDLDFSAGTGVPGQPGAEPVTPGPDGKCVIQDGSTTITAERPPGSPDQVVVTIDDGTGNPTTYTMDYRDPANPQVVDGGQVPGQPQPAFAAGPPMDPAASAASYGSGREPSGAGISGAGISGPGGAQPLAQPVGAAEPGQVTMAADGGGAFGGSPGTSGMWSAFGNLFGDSGAGQNGGGFGDTTAHQAGPAGEAGLASTTSEPSPSQQGAAGAPMMSGMGAIGGMGAGVSGGGDEQRTGSTWTLVGNLFDDAVDNVSEQISGALGHER